MRSPDPHGLTGLLRVSRFPGDAFQNAIHGVRVKTLIRNVRSADGAEYRTAFNFRYFESIVYEEERMLGQVGVLSIAVWVVFRVADKDLCAAAEVLVDILLRGLLRPRFGDKCRRGEAVHIIITDTRGSKRISRSPERPFSFLLL